VRRHRECREVGTVKKRKLSNMNYPKGISEKEVERYWGDITPEDRKSAKVRLCGNARQRRVTPASCEGCADDNSGESL